MDEKLKAAVEEALFSSGMPVAYGEKHVDRITTALSHHGVVVQAEVSQELHEQIETEISAPIPLTYAAACALQPGDEVVCLDVGCNGDILEVGQKYLVARNHHVEPFVKSDARRFFLNTETCRLFAAVPKEGMVKKECAARKQNSGANYPADCDWPGCGCDPHADKVIAALQESGVIVSLKEQSDLRTRATAAEAEAAKAKAAVERVRMEAALFLGHGKYGESHYLDGKLDVANRIVQVAGFTIHPPAQPLRVTCADELASILEECLSVLSFRHDPLVTKARAALVKYRSLK